eukprot:1242572-Amphidinium_carterae.1
MAAALHAPTAPAVLQELKRAVESYEKAKEIGTAWWDKLCERSILKHKRMEQVVHLAKGSSWQMTDALQSLLQHQFGCISGTKAIEDCSGVQTRHQISRNSQRKLQDLRAWTCVVQSELESRVHRFKSVSPVEASPPKDVQSSVPELFKHRPRGAPQSLRGIVSSSRTPEYFSPNPQNQHIHREDLALIRRCAEKNNHESASRTAWGTVVFNGECLVVHCIIRKPVPKTSFEDAFIKKHTPFNTTLVRNVARCIIK